jgi:hypothetical protein
LRETRTLTKPQTTSANLHRIAIALVLGVLLFDARPARAQGSASVSGRVTDPTDAVVTNAAIELVDLDTGVSRTTTTNQEGMYSLVNLKPGRYLMRVRKDGFETALIAAMVLNVWESHSRNVALQVGAITTSTTVTADSSHLNTTDGSLSTVIERQTVENLPLNGRSFQSLLNLTPGINPINPMSVTPGQVQKAQGQFTVNGQRPDANYFLVDGVSANTGVNSGGLLGQGGTGSLPATTALGGYNGLVSVDALQEFRVTTSTFAPENGRTPGGQVSLSTRSGSNVLHGDLFDYFRDTGLTARDWFLDRAGLPKGTVNQHDFGGVIGGPIVKDRLFSFLSYEGLRLKNVQPGISQTFTRDARYLASHSSNGSTPASAGYMAQLLNAYPVSPNDVSRGDGSTCTSAETCVAEFTGAFPTRSRLDSTSVRLDYAIRGNATLFGRYVHAPSSTVASGSLAAINDSALNLTSDSMTVGWTQTLSPTMTNDLRVNHSRMTLSESLSAPSFAGSLGTLFPTGLAQPPAGVSPDDILLSFVFAGLGVPSLNVGPKASRNSQVQFNAVDALSMIRGSHLLKFGADFRLTDPTVNKAGYNLIANFYSSEGAPFCGAAPSDRLSPFPPSPLPQFICGKASNTIVQGSSEQQFRFQNWSLFAQDTWTPARRLTLTYGLRWEIDPAPSSRNGKPLFSLKDFDPIQCTRTPRFSPGTTICDVGVNPLGTPAYPTRWSNFAPRLGVAYQLSESPTFGTMLRGGVGTFYDTGHDAASATLGPFAPSVVGLLPNSPCRSSGSSAGGIGTGSQYIQFPITDPACLTPPPVQSNIGPGTPYSTIAQAAVPDLKLPRTYEFNGSVEQAFGGRQSVTLSYVGAVGSDQIGAIPMIERAQLQSNVIVPVSPTFPTFLVVYGNYASSRYDALQVQFRRRFHEGLGATASYTWAHSTDDASNFNAGVVFPFAVNQADSDFDIRHTVALSLIWEAPAPRSSLNFARLALRGWSFAPIFHFQTAPPINPVALLSPSADETFTLITRPNIISGVSVYVDGADCAAEYGAPCPGGRGLNNAAVGARLGATEAQAAAAGCAPGTVVGAFCRPGGGITPGAGSASEQGNAGRNSLRGFPLQQLDVAIRRDFTVGDRLRLRFEADIFNVFNHSNFASPSAVLTDTNFGRSQSMMNASFGGSGGYNSLYAMGGPRAAQLAAKLLF